MVKSPQLYHCLFAYIIKHFNDPWIAPQKFSKCFVYPQVLTGSHLFNVRGINENKKLRATSDHNFWRTTRQKSLQLLNF